MDDSVRASDEDRSRVVERLSRQAGLGYLTLAEAEERIGQAYEATTHGELALVTADLPEPAPAAPAPTTTRRRKATRWIVSLMGGNDRRGRWRVAERVNVVSVMGGADLDLRHAEIDGDEVTIVAVTVMGGIDVYVPDTVDLEVSGFSVMGGNDENGSTRPPRPGAPRVRVRAFSVMGGIDVWRLPEEAAHLPIRQAKRLARATG